MKKLVLIIILNLLVGCGELMKDVKNPHGGYWESEFEPYLSKFLEVGQKYGFNPSLGNLSIMFDDKLNDTSTLGVCVSQGSSRQVFINRKNWDGWTKMKHHAGKEELIFHELGHCLLNRGHITASVPLFNGNTGEREHFDGEPDNHSGSIMYKHMVGASVYLYNWEKYTKELFTRILPDKIYAGGVRDFDDSDYAANDGILIITKKVESFSQEIKVYKMESSVEDGVLVHKCNHNH